MDRAITLGMTNSAFPASFDGSSNLFAFVLFALIVASCIGATLGTMQVRQLWADRRFGRDLSWAFNSLVLAVCIGLLMRCLPDTCYMIAFGDAAASTLQNILIVKRVMDFCFLAPLVFWSGLFMMYRVDILFKLRSPTSYVYTDFRWAALTRFTGLVLTSAALAVCITLGRLYH